MLVRLTGVFLAVVWMKNRSSSPSRKAEHSVRSIRVGLAVLVFLLSYPTAAEPTHTVQHYTAEDGLAGAVVRSIERTSDGMMWFGCWGRGVSAYDGMTWWNYGMDAGLPSLDVRSVRLDQFGRLWVGTATGVACRVGERWQPVEADVPGGDALPVFAIVPIPNGELWFGLSDGRIVSFAQDGEIDPGAVPRGTWAVVLDQATSGSPDAIEAICPTERGEILVGTDERGILRYRDGQWSQDPGDELATGADSIAQTPDGTLYAGGGTGLWVLAQEQNSWSRISADSVRSLGAASRNEVAVAFQYHAEHRNRRATFPIQLLSNVESIATQTIRHFSEVEETWVGTKMGVFRVGTEGWTRFPRTIDGAGLGGVDLFASTRVPATTVDNHGAVRQYVDDRWRVAGQLEPGDYHSISAGANQALWFVKTGLVIRWDTDTGDVLDQIVAPPDVYSVLESRSGHLIGLCEERVLEFRDGAWETTPAGPRAEVEAVTSAILTSRDELFVSTLTALTLWELEEDGGLREKERLESEKNFRGLVEEPDGSILVGANEEGIFRYRDGTLQLEIPFDKDPSARIRQLFRASNGRLWSGANELGIASYQDGRWTHYRSEDGVPDGGVAGFAEDPNGHLWATIDSVGIVRYVPSADPPETMIRQVPSQIPHRERSVLQFSGRDPWNITRADDLVYSWRILRSGQSGLEVPWRPYIREESIISPSLPHGNYEFEVRAADTDFNVDPEPARAVFTVLPPLWATWGFIVPVALLALASLTTAVLLFRNYAALRVSEQYLREARDQAVAASSAKSQFLAHVSHEIRTPMNAILGHVQVMQLSGSRTPEDRENLDIISKSGDHLLELINDVLEMAKIESGRVTLSPSTFDYRDLIAQIVQMLSVQCDPERLTLRHETGDSVPAFIVCDQGKLRQVLINLTGNAIKFTERGAIVLRSRAVRVPDTTDRLDLVIEIEDTGSGIDPESLKRIFEPFEQASAGRDLGGAGLGLPICRRHVEIMGGTISVDSELDRGTWVQVRIPVAEGKAPVFRESMAGSEDAPMNNSGTRVLVVDDIDTNLKVMEKLLNRFGFSVQGVSNGADAIKVFSEWGPDVILMDSAMPGMDGKETTRRIRTMKGGAAIPIIFVTGGALDDDWDRILESGASAIIRKPFRHAELLDKIAECMGES